MKTFGGMWSSPARMGGDGEKTCGVGAEWGQNTRGWSRDGQDILIVGGDGDEIVPRVSLSTAQYHTHDIHRIRHHIPLNAPICSANVVLTTETHWNSFITGISKASQSRINHGQAITKTPKYGQISPILQSLHWRPIEERITFKTGLIVYMTLHFSQPYYLSLCGVWRLLYTSPGFLTFSIRLSMTRTALGWCAFAVAGPRLWNSLSTNVCSAVCSDLQISPTNSSFSGLNSSIGCFHVFLDSPLGFLTRLILQYGLHKFLLAVTINWHLKHYDNDTTEVRRLDQ